MIPLGVLAAAYPRAVAPASGWTFDPDAKNPNVVLSNGNRTASTTSGGGHRQALGGSPKARAGKWYIELVVDSAVSGFGDLSFGVSVAGVNFLRTDYPSDVGQAAYWSRQAGNLARLYDRTTYTTLASIPANVAKSGDIITLAVNFDAGIAYQAYLNGTLLNATPKTSPLPVGDFVPFVTLWGGASKPTTVTIPETPQHPPAGFLPW